MVLLPLRGVASLRFDLGELAELAQQLTEREGARHHPRSRREVGARGGLRVVGRRVEGGNGGAECGDLRLQG